VIVFGEVRQLEQCSAMATFVLKVLIISSVSLALSLSARRKNMLCMVVKKPFFLLENRSFSCLLAKRCVIVGKDILSKLLHRNSHRLNCCSCLSCRYRKSSSSSGLLCMRCP
jgi:hypothetical protein